MIEHHLKMFGAIHGDAIIRLEEVVFGEPDPGWSGVAKFDLPGAESLGGVGREIAFREVNRQSTRKCLPRDPPLLGMMVKNGFREAAAVKIPSTNEKDSLLRVLGRRRLRTCIHEGIVYPILTGAKCVVFFFAASAE